MDNTEQIKGWKLYFPEKDNDDDFKEEYKKIWVFQNYIKRKEHLYSFKKIEEQHFFTIDLLLIKNDDVLKEEWPNFLEDLNSETEHTLNYLGLAMYQICINRMANEEIGGELKIIRARIINHEPIINLKNFKVNYYGKLVSIRGTVIRTSEVKLICRCMAFKCSSCGGTQILKQPDGIYTLPNHCPTKGCRAKGRFIPELLSSQTEVQDYQKLKLQELIDVEQIDGGRIPRTIECELTDDLVKSCAPGDDITITGLIKAQNSGKSPVFVLYLDAVSLVNSKSQSSAGASSTLGVEFNLSDYYAIEKIYGEQCIFKLLVQSLCPKIIGHEMIKAGLLLALFSSSSDEKSNGTIVADIRTEAHVLMVGDPGLGKSQMLQACANVAPRGIFVCGNTSTTSGLTATMTRESGGEYSMEAGALVLASDGCCCIDEFDKMSSQHAALLEAMEQQSVSIAKAGIVCTMPTRTCILAAANPVGGHYNRGKTVSENLRMNAALLSRFDLVFILRDKPNKVLDGLLSEHILALRTGTVFKRASSPESEDTANKNKSNETTNNSSAVLNDRLRLNQDEEMSPLPHQLLRKYIAYATKYVHTKLSPESGDILKQFYLELRRKHQTSDGTPVTTRQIQSLTRLTLARAKLELREETSVQDALDVIEIMKYSLVDTFTDEFNELDFKRSQHGSGMSQRNKVKKFIASLQRKAEVEGRSTFSKEELKNVAINSGAGGDFHSFLDTLNIHGYLLKKSSDTYKLLSVED